jgi:very-short-patch-repair endonuclease
MFARCASRRESSPARRRGLSGSHRPGAEASAAAPFFGVAGTLNPPPDRRIVGGVPGGAPVVSDLDTLKQELEKLKAENEEIAARAKEGKSARPVSEWHGILRPGSTVGSGVSGHGGRAMSTRPRGTPDPEVVAKRKMVGDAVARLQKRLLDLTPRNKLLNFRHTKRSTVRVVDELPDQLFSTLVDGKTLTFQPLPAPTEMQEAANKDESLVAEVAGQAGIAMGFDLPRAAEDGSAPRKHEDRYIQTLLFPDDLENNLKHISNRARTAIEESGTNMLYLAFGFLEWFESESSETPRLAPLVMLPVTIERRGMDAATGTFEFCISYSGEDICENLSLVEKLRTDFRVEVPAVEDDDAPESYWAKVESLVKPHARWRLRRYVSLSLFHFGRLLLFRDLDAATWGDQSQLLDHPIICKLLLGDAGATQSAQAETEYPIDEVPEKERSISLVDDADSSQLSAIIDVVEHENLVVEGPPGTGKSQTITNLVAACLKLGRTVLFVSEKLAALEVVRRRLDRLGLGEFCLELHSHRTQKKQLIGDIERRLQRQGHFRSPRELQEEREALDRKRRKLIALVEELRRPAEYWGETAQAVLCAAARYRQDAEQFGLKELLDIDCPREGGRQHLEECRAAIASYGSAFETATHGLDGLESHPWYGVAPADPSAIDILTVATRLRGWIAATTSLSSGLSDLGNAFQVKVPKRETDAALLVSAASRLPVGTGNELGQLLTKIGDCTDDQFLRQFASDLDRLKALRQAVSNSLGGGPLPSEQAVEVVRAGVAELESARLDVAELGRTIDFLREIVVTIEEFASLVPLLKVVSADLGIEIPHSLWGLTLCRAVVQLCAQAPLELLPLRCPQLAVPQFVVALGELGNAIDALRSEGATLQQDFQFDLEQAAEAVTSAAGQLVEGGAFCWFSSSWKAANRVYRRTWKGAVRGSSRAKGQRLQRLADWMRRRDNLTRDAVLTAVLGDLNKGFATDVTRLRRLVAWDDQVRRVLSESARTVACTRSVTNAPEVSIERVGSLASSADVHKLNTLEELLRKLAAQFPKLVSVDERITEPSLRDKVLGLRQSLETIWTGLRAARIPEAMTTAQVNAVVETCLQRSAAEKAAAGNAPARAVVADLEAAVVASPEKLQATLDYVGSLRAIGLPAALNRAVLRSGDTKDMELLRAMCSKLAPLLASYGRANKALLNAGGVDESCWFRGKALHAVTLEDVEARGKRALEDERRLSDLLEYLAARVRCTKAGLGPLLECFEAGGVGLTRLEKAFLASAYDKEARRLLAERPVLASFNAGEHESIRTDFQLLDARVIANTRLDVAAAADTRQVPRGIGTGPIKERTELALLQHEVGKQRRHLPIRQLMRRSGRALQALKPCFMMGPLSVAQYLEAGNLEFDILIMDEASQIRLEHALGAIGRCRQIVVVGDSKQLPPTTFFDASFEENTDGDDDEALTASEDTDSVLDAARAAFRGRQLRWHYRSRHHSLIEFSNHHFYNDNLIVFPAASDEADGHLGVVFHHVAGTYNKSLNVKEAAAVADAVLQHMLTSKESLGVAAMNIQQTELIDSEIDRRLKQSALARNWVDRRKDGAEPFFVKNLENVQGDERDVIFVSITYGPDASGHVRKTFGPINREGGARRLNVLFSRARRRLEVFSTMRGGEIAIEGIDGVGAQTLRQYLEFAETGRSTEQSIQAGRDPDSDFEVAVLDALRDRGYRGVPQVGTAGYRIDIGVVDPDESGKFLLGIECDGATYHSSRCARDRDRLRERILKDMGWSLFRIWSTDWFKNRARVIDRLVCELESARKAADLRRQSRPPPKVVSLPAADPVLARTDLTSSGSDAVSDSGVAASAFSRDELRERLVQLRENSLLLRFGDAAPSACLLRNEMIEELVSKVPTNEEEFRELISPPLRKATDLQQFHLFKDYVFSVLRGGDLELPEFEGLQDRAPASERTEENSLGVQAHNGDTGQRTSEHTERPRYSSISEAVVAVAPEFRHAACPKCRAATAVTVSDQGVVLSCKGTCQSSQRVSSAILQKVADDIDAKCYNCGHGHLKSLERHFGTILRCDKCDSNNTWQAVSQRYFGK